MNTVNSNSNRTQSFLHFFMASALLCVCVSTLRAQVETQGNRLITESKFKDQPAVIGEVRMNGNRVELNNRFSRPEKDWLKHLSLDVRNVSDKTITYVQVRLMFEQIGGNGTPCIFPLVRGIDTVLRGLDSPSKSKVTVTDPNDVMRAILVRPGDTVSLAFDDNAYNGLQKFLKDANWEGEVSNVKVYFSRVIFENGTIWMKGIEVKPDILTPNKFSPIFPKESSRRIYQSDEYRLSPANFSSMTPTTPRKTAVKAAGFESGCTSASSTYFLQCGVNVFYQCYNETWSPYSFGAYAWRDVQLSCFDQYGYYCNSTSTVREVYGDCYYVKNGVPKGKSVIDLSAF
jgi:hypothetical protein